MVTVRVFLECAAPTNRPGGLYDTFIALPEASFLRGAHISMACDRAAVLGFNAPYRVVEVRRLDQPRMSFDEVCSRLKELVATTQDRCLGTLSGDCDPRPGVAADVTSGARPGKRSATQVARRQRAPQR